MSDFQPPLAERETEELLVIIMHPERWTKKVIKASQIELLKRNISLEEQEEIIQELKEIEWEEDLEEASQKQLEKNKTESFKLWEMLLLLLIAPIVLIHPIFDRLNPLVIYKQKYYLKVKQGIIITILSISLWYLYYQHQQKQRKAEIEKIDISDWKKKYGYE